MGWLARLFGWWIPIPAVKPPVITPSKFANINPHPCNLSAFLTTIAYSEGTLSIPDSENGYKALFGGGTFTSYADHPRKEFYIARLKIYTSASGRYQIEKATFDRLKTKLGLKDFSPASQDACAIELITERGALADATAGRLGLAVMKCSPEWASFPQSKAGQPITPIGSLMAAYAKAGGKLEDWRQPTLS